MKIERALLSSLVLLLALHTNGAQVFAVEQSNASFSIGLERGALQLKGPSGNVVSGIRLRLRFSDGTALAGELEQTGPGEQGADRVGRYERLRYRLKPVPPAVKTAVNAILELRHYLQPEIVIASLDYDGPALAEREGVQLLMGLDSFARGMASKRLKLYWTAPAFVSDYRMLGPSNQLLLWRQIQGDDYHLLIPLAGGGMIGEVGVSEINYRYEFRIAASSYDPKFAPRHVPLFAYAASLDPYLLPRLSYGAAFEASDQYGRLRWQKSYPEVFDWLGWCSWNAYEHAVTEEKVLESVRSLRSKKIPIGFVLVDDGWLSTKDDKLVSFNADPSKFPGDLSGLARKLREQYHVPHVGVWHTFQGYWSGVDSESEIGRAHPLFKGLDGKALPDPRDGRGESFYAAWYARLKEWGYDFVKVDGQGNNLKFTNGLMPLFESGGGEHRNFQEAARKYFSDAGAGNEGRAAGLNVINCMEMSLENAYNWRISNIARNSDDYLPDTPQNAKEHTYYNAYNAYWTSNFAYPDWDMFQSHDANGAYHAVARAISGGPVYITDKPGREQPEVVLPLAFSDGRLLRLDEPGQVTRDLLLTDVALEPVALKVAGRITRNGLQAGMVAAFNVNKSAQSVAGRIKAADVEALQGAGVNGPNSRVAVYRRSSGQAQVLDAKQADWPFTLDSFGYDLFTVVPVNAGVAVFGLLDKYLGPAAVVSQKTERGRVSVRLREAGTFGAWLDERPLRVELDGRELLPFSYSYTQGVLRIPRPTFGDQPGEHEIRITLRAPVSPQRNGSPK